MSNREFYCGVTFIQESYPAHPVIGDTWLGGITGECLRLYNGFGRDRGWSVIGGYCNHEFSRDFMVPSVDCIHEDSINGTIIQNGKLELRTVVDEYSYPVSGYYLDTSDVNLGIIPSPKLVLVTEHIAYCFGSTTSKFVIIDISNKNNPSITQSLDLGINSIFDMIVDGNFLYISTGVNHKVHIYNILDILNPTLVTTLSIDYAYGITVSGNYLYVNSGMPVTGDNSQNKMWAINISDKSNIELVHYVSSANLKYGSQCVTFGNYLYVVGEGFNKLTIIDKSNPINITVFKTVGAIDIPGIIGVCVLNNYAYVISKGTPFPILYVINVSNKANPVIESSRPIEVNNNGLTIKIQKEIIYISSYSGITMLDISDKEYPTLIGTSIFDETQGCNCVTVSNNYVYMCGTNTSVTSSLHGIFSIIDLDNKSLVRSRYTSKESYYCMFHFNLIGINTLDTLVTTHNIPLHTSIKGIFSFNNKVTWNKTDGNSLLTYPLPTGLDNAQDIYLNGSSPDHIDLYLSNLDVSSYDSLDILYDLKSNDELTTPWINSIVLTTK